MKKRIFTIITILSCLMLGLCSCDILELFGTTSDLNEKIKPNIEEIVAYHSPKTVSYDIKITSSDTNITLEGSCWMTETKARIDTGALVAKITIYQDYETDTQYTYSKSLKTAYRSNMDLSKYSYKSWLESIDMNTCKVIGEQRLNGKVCAVYECGDNEDNKWTVWLYEKYAFPVKIQNNNFVIEFSNISINKKIKDEIFALPEGTKIIEAPVKGDDISNAVDTITNFISGIDIGKIIGGGDKTSSGSSLDIGQIIGDVGKIIGGGTSSDTNIDIGGIEQIISDAVGSNSDLNVEDIIGIVKASSTDLGSILEEALSSDSQLSEQLESLLDSASATDISGIIGSAIGDIVNDQISGIANGAVDAVAGKIGGLLGKITS